MAEPNRVNVINPLGELVSLPEERLELASQAGYRLATDADLEVYAAKEKWGNRPLEAAAAGAFGWLVGGERGRETIENLEKYNPGAAITGTIASYLAPGAIVRGARSLPLIGRLAGPAAAGALAPQLGITALGQATERYLSTKLAQGAVTLGTRGLVEGAAVGGFDYLNEVALGDDVDFNVEQLYQAMEGGGLFGAATGVGMGAILGGIRKAGSKLVNQVGKGSEVNFLTRTIGRGVEEMTGGEVAARDFNTLAGDSDLYFKARNAPRTRAKTFDATLPKMRRVVELTDEALDMATKGIRKEQHVAQAIPDNIDVNIAAGAMEGELAEIRMFFTDLAENSTEAALKKAGRTWLSESQKTLENTAGKFAEAKTPKAQATELFLGFNEVRKLTQEMVSRNISSLTLESMEANRAYLGARQLLKTRVEPFLENAEIWGAAGDMQRRINGKASRFIDATKVFENDFTRKLDIGDYDHPVRQLKDESWNTYINKGLHRAKGDRHEAVSQYFEAWREYIKELKSALKLGPKEIAKLDEVLTHLDEVDRSLNVAKGDTHWESILKGVEQVDRRGREESYLGMVAGGLAFGRLGTAAALASRPFTQPGLYLHTLARLSRWIGETGQKYEQGLNKIARTSLSAPAAAADREYEKTSGVVKELPSGPALAETMLQNMPEVTAVAPDHVLGLAAKAGQARDYLLRKIPVTESGALGQPNATLSKTEISQWLEKVMAVKKPTQLLEDLASAKLSMSAVRTIRSVYPKWFEKFARDLTSEIIDKGERGLQLPYQLRIQAAMLLDVPTDPMLNFSYISQMKAMYSAQGTRQRAQSAKRVRGQPELAGAYTTGSEETQNAD